MSKPSIYKINLFWTDEEAAEDFKDSYTKERIERFLVQKTIERINRMPTTRRDQIINYLTQQRET